MALGPHHEVANLRATLGELSFEARIGGRARTIWMRTETAVTPAAEAALAACLMPAMREGGTLTMTDPISPRVLRTQREFEAIQRAWSQRWTFGGEPLREVEVEAPVRVPEPASGGRVAVFFSGGVDSWSTVLDNPDVTDLIFVRGFDLLPGTADQEQLGNEVETRLRDAAAALGLPLHVLNTNLRELSDGLLLWDIFYGCAVVAVAHFFSPLFERALIAGDSDYAMQEPFGANWMVDQLWSSERLEIVDDGGRHNRMERLGRIAAHPVVQRTLRVCWQNPGGAYNCGSCGKCLLTLAALEALGARHLIATFPDELDLDAVAGVEITLPARLTLWEDVLDASRAAGRHDLERAVEATVSAGRRRLGLAPSRRRRATPGPPATVRLAAIVPVWNQARYLSGAVRSALDQETGGGVGVVIVNDGCPDPETHRIGQALRDADPDRVAYLRQPNGGLSAARNAGIRLALARWPRIEAVFPLDADNLLSPQTLPELAGALDREPRAAWASPALEIFGSERGEWQISGDYLPYRQLFTNQCDAGSLIRRDLFDAGFEYDETMRSGFEDWELFLRASLAGFDGVLAGRCGFRYRRRPDSMLSKAQPLSEALEGEIQRRHPRAYEPTALARREHAEAPRFALVRLDRDDVLLTASCDLEPRWLSLADFARSIAPLADPEPCFGHVPAITVLSTAATLDRLDREGQLAETLFRLQTALRGEPAAGLRIGPGPVEELSAIAIRATALALLPDGVGLEPEAVVDAEAATLGEPLPEPGLKAATALLGTATRGVALPENSHPRFFEHLHIEEMRTTFPGSPRAGAGATA